MFAGKRAVFALADELHIQQWTPMTVTSSVLESATEFLQGIRASLEESKPDPGLKFRAELASVEVQSSQLVGA